MSLGGLIELLRNIPWELLGGLLLIAILVIAAAIFTALLEPDGPRPYDYRRRKMVMTKAEAQCFRILLEITNGKYYVFPQLHLPSILDHRVNNQKWGGAFHHISQKSVDFVLCDIDALQPRLAIELDDWSHERPTRQARDKEVERILEEAGMPLLRITDVENLREKIEERLNSSNS